MPAGRLLRRCAEAAVAAWLLAGCTFTFGNSDDAASSLSPRERNSLYLREQEEEVRRRQGPTFDTIIPNR